MSSRMNKYSFLTVCLNPTLQKTIVLQKLVEDEVNRTGEHYWDASGKGINVSRVLTQLGADVLHLTQVGGRNRQWFLELAKRDRISCAPVDSCSEVRFCYTVLNKEHHTSTEIVEEGAPVDLHTEKRVFQEYLELMPLSRTIIISGTKAAGFSNALFPEMVREARKIRKRVILDIKGSDLLGSLPYQPDIIKPNFSEFLATFFDGLPVNESQIHNEVLESVQTKMVEIYQQFGTTTILTRGKYGVLFVDQGKVFSLPAPKINPVNAIGCGDAFTAGLANQLGQETDIRIAIAKGLECAKLNALSVHPGMINQTDTGCKPGSGLVQ